MQTFVTSSKKNEGSVLSEESDSNILKMAPEDEIENNDPALKNILQQLLEVKQVDFTHYKMNTSKDESFVG